MRRRVVAGLLLAVVLAVLPRTARAAPDSTLVFHFKGRAAFAVLTDCPVGPPAGTTCRAVSVSAFEQRVNEKGEKIGTQAGLSVTLYDVTILAVEPLLFDAVPIGQGFTQDAVVDLRGLSKAEVVAVDVGLCNFSPCPSGAPDSISLSVHWSGIGPTSGFRSHDKFDDVFCSVNSISGGSSRAADASGLVDGRRFEQTVLPQFQPSLSSNAFATIRHCAL